MRAFVQPRPGRDAVERAEVPIPRIDTGELLVRVHAVGVGIHDSYFLPPEALYPFVIGIEAAGVVAQVGAGVMAFRPGDRIAFVSSMQTKGGTWAEYAVLDQEAMIVLLPAGMDFEEAAALPVAAGTVLRSMAALSGVSTGAAIFIAGGSGAIGTLAIQIARRLGWRVAVSASPRNHDYVRDLGAELAVDYGDRNWRRQVQEWLPGGVDAAIAVQPGTAVECLPLVRDGGVLIAVSGDQVAPERGIRVGGVPLDVDVRPGLAQLFADVTAGEVRVVIEQGYPFDRGLDALAKVRTRRARGKVVLRLEPAAATSTS